jgi:hypothetical protein
MELLLNLIWVTLGMGAFLTLMWRRPQSSLGGLPYHRALLTLACVLLLLFPIVSVSDDLHPTQALLEEAPKRIQHFVSPLQAAHSSYSLPMLSMLLTLSVWCAPAAWQLWPPLESSTHALSGYRFSSHGRAPPAFVC